MAFRIDPADEGLRDSLVRIATEETGRARAEIDDPTLTTERTIHQARKRTKRLRGLLRLVRSACPDYDAEAEALRAAARGLSRLRDRDVMIATHDSVMETTGAERRRYAAVRAHFTRARNRVAAQQDPHAALAAYAQELEDLGNRAPDWTLAGKDRAVLEAGLARTWSRARRAMKRARTGRDIEDMHDWRKRVKDHWYQARLLTPLDPERIKEQARATGELGEILGDFHDLDVYRLHLQGPEASGLDPERRAELVAMAEARMNELKDDAFARGSPLFDIPADTLSAEWGALWKRWRKAARAHAANGSECEA
ncbi:MAG: CHAD domain-containing protein [Pseudomonadota bacterium]